jgi:hypothetical protein
MVSRTRSSWFLRLGTPFVLGCSMLPGIHALEADRASGPWIAFRYDANHLLFYFAEAKDPDGPTQQAAEERQLAQPLARWGSGGYLLPLAADRWETFRPKIRPGERISVRLNRDTAITANIDSLVEQWGAANPVVQIGALAQVNPAQMSAFRSEKSDYFLAYLGSPSAPAAPAAPTEIAGSRSILNRFGELSELVLVHGDDGWSIRLWRRIDGRLVPTAVSYAYGD